MSQHIVDRNDSTKLPVTNHRHMSNLMMVHKRHCLVHGGADVASNNFCRHEVRHGSIDYVPAKSFNTAYDIFLRDKPQNRVAIIGNDERACIVDFKLANSLG